MPAIINGNTTRDVYLQDQYSDNVAMLMHRDLGTVTLASDAAAGSYTVTLTVGHGASEAELLYFIEGQYFTETIIANVTDNTITLDRPLDIPYTTAATLTRASWAGNVDGSSTPVTFHALPPTGVTWDIKSVRMAISDGTEMDDAKFGGITALTRGLLLRMKLDSRGYHNVGLAKSNSDLASLCTLTYSSKAPAGTYGLRAKCDLSNESGVTLRVYQDKGQELELIVQDDLTDLTSVKFLAIGHVVI